YISTVPKDCLKANEYIADVIRGLGQRPYHLTHWWHVFFPNKRNPRIWVANINPENRTMKITYRNEDEALAQRITEILGD
ncbi:MAG: hypothetical protein U9O54_06550, partial [Chloroflexota bacterium]|nr:hypothetical protein [Chloroflexota bacterium]